MSATITTSTDISKNEQVKYKVEWREKNLARKKNQLDFLSLMISVAETYLILSNVPKPNLSLSHMTTQRAG